MITIEEYVGPHKDSIDWTPTRMINAEHLLAKCAMMESLLVSRGAKFPINPVTHSGVSGVTFGGFRPQSCPQGAPDSAHKEGRGVDRFDPDNLIDKVIKDDYDLCASQNREGDALLVQCDLYIEHPSATDSWSHWTDRPPKSKHRIYLP